MLRDFGQPVKLAPVQCIGYAAYCQSIPHVEKVVSNDILDDDCPVVYIPTDRQISFKLKLHKAVNPAVLNKLTKESICLLKNVVAPFTIEEIQKWADATPLFFEWLLAPDDSDILLHKAKTKAANVLIDILDIPCDDPKTLALKIKAAELTLKINQPPQQKIINKLSLPGGIPKELLNKPIDALQGELKRLQEA